jgi:drug/metabolite transporter (DMT)-like permease
VRVSARGRRTEGLILAFVAAALWGLTPVATKGALAGWSPELLSVLRLGVSTLALRALGGAGTPWLPTDPWAWLAGFMLGADFVLYNYGIRHTTAAVAGLIINVEVGSGIVFSRWLLDERLGSRRLLGAGLTLAGVAWVGTEGVGGEDILARERLFGNALVMLAALCWSVFAVAQRLSARRGGIANLVAPIFGAATLTSLPGLLTPGAWSTPAGIAPTLHLLVLILACTLGVYLIYARTQELLELTVLTTVLASIPIFTVGFAWYIAGEPVSPRLLTGGLAIAAGIAITARE